MSPSRTCPYPWPGSSSRLLQSASNQRLEPSRRNPRQIAVTVSPEPDGETHGLLYVRSGGAVRERLLGPVGGEAPVAVETEIADAIRALGGR